MYDEEIRIDIEALRRDLKEDCMGALFGGGFGAALIDSIDIDRASDDEVIRIAQRQGFNIFNYQL